MLQRYIKGRPEDATSLMEVFEILWELPKDVQYILMAKIEDSMDKIKD